MLALHRERERGRGRHKSFWMMGEYGKVRMWFVSTNHFVPEALASSRGLNCSRLQSKYPKTTTVVFNY